MAHPLSEGNQVQSRKCGGQVLGVSLWEIPNKQFRAQEHRVAPGLPGRSWAGGVLNKGRQGKRGLVRVKAKKVWKGSDAGFFDQSFKKGERGGLLK